LAALARLRGASFGVVVRTAENLASGYRRCVCWVYSVRPAGWRAISSIAWFIPADTVQVLIAALGLSYSFDRAPRLIV